MPIWQPGMGDELRELSRMLPVAGQAHSAAARSQQLALSQAAKLVGMGASIDDLTQSCGLSQRRADEQAARQKP